MVFAHPAWLLSAVAVLAIAAWSLFRPARPLVTVGSLELWQAALRQAGAGARWTRAIRPSWALLLLGALATALALTGPAWRFESGRRVVAIGVCPSAELGAEGLAELQSAGDALLGRLAPGDEVRLLLPTALGEADSPLSTHEARARLAGLRLLPAAGADLTFGLPDESVQHTYWLAPAGVLSRGGEAQTLVEFDTHLPPITIEAVGASASGLTLVTLRNHAAEPTEANVIVSADANERRGAVPVSVGQTATALLSIAPAGGIRIAAGSDWRCRAALAMRESPPVRTAIVGRGEALLDRYIAADERLTPATTPDEADLLLVVGQNVSPDFDGPAIVFAPPSSPAGWLAGRESVGLDLKDADVDNLPDLPGLDLAGVLVRGTDLWRPSDATVLDQMLLAHDAQALAVLQRGPGRATRAYLSFDPAPEKTNLLLSQPGVAFLSGLVSAALGERGDPGGGYTWLSPLDASPADGWTEAGSDRPADPIPQPGLYRDADGRFRGVALPGLRAGIAPRRPEDVLADAPLPEPARARPDWPLTAPIGVLAGLLWLGGWLLASRGR